MELLEYLMPFGPTRRSDKTVVEWVLRLEEDECRALRESAESIRRGILAALARVGVEPDALHPLLAPLPELPSERCGWLLAATALALQQHAGHRVEFLCLVPPAAEDRCRSVFEFEHGETGDQAGELAFRLLLDQIPGSERKPPLENPEQGFSASFQAFVQAAADSVLPRDAQFIIDAARRLDVPCVKLEREPYAGLEGSFRVRRNGLLKLGHACRQQVVDGTFCIERNEALAPLVHDREAVRRLLESVGVPLPRRHPRHLHCLASGRAARVAAEIGFPVVVKPRTAPRSAGDAAVALDLRDAGAVRAAAGRALQIGRGALLEAHVPGNTYKVLVANGEIIAVVALRDGCACADVTAVTHPSTLDLARHIADRLDAALLTLTLVSTDPGRPLGEHGAVVNLNVAPELDGFLRDGQPFDATAIHDRAAEGLVRHLFPEGAPSRIPLIAVTGTNGKTTICNMIARIVQASGCTPGRAGTTGFFLGEECIEFSEFSGGSGHHKVLECDRVDFGVLETARGAAITMGFMFDWCNVAVCTNVTPDHLGQHGVDTLEQMTALKLSIMQRARDAVVLNADDANSAGMLPQLADRVAWMVSAEHPAGELRERYGSAVNCCVAERQGDEELLILYVDGNRLPVMPVAEIPVTFGGTLRFNVSNALQAAAASCAAGVGIDTIRQALAQFDTDYASNPGRMNFYRDLPFTVLMDYAHNEDGIRQLLDVVDRLPVRGRRIVCLALVGRLADEEVLQLAGRFASSFDFFFCCNYPNRYGREPNEIPALCRQALQERGVPESCIEEVPGEGYLQRALALCREGDLLVHLTSTAGVHEDWTQITSFQPAADN